MTHPEMSGSTVTFDPVTYDTYAKALVLKIATKALSSCVRSGFIHLANDGTLSKQDENKWYDLVFVMLASLEDHGPLPTSPPVLPCVLFADRRPQQDELNAYLASEDRSALHGNLDDEILAQAIKAVFEQQ